jgi:hypothetical protein
VKVLILGNSNDTGTFVPQDAKRSLIMRDMFAAEFGEPVEVATCNPWPDNRIVEFVEREVNRVEPDLVYLQINGYSFSYESLPLRVKRIFGKLGEPVGDAGMRLADNRTWSHNAAFRLLRRAGQATIGGDTHLTPEEVTARYSDLIRSLLRRENLVLVVKGPMGRSDRGTSREKARREARRQRVHPPLKALCEKLHVTYIGNDEPRFRTHKARKGTRVGDGMHANAEGHKDAALEHYAYLRGAWQAHLEREGAPVSTASNKPTG